MRFVKGAVVFVAALLLMTGCAMNNEARDNGNNQNNAQNQGFQNVGYNNQNNQGNRMRVADKAQDKIEDLTEVKSANVIVTNRNAYVAVVLEDDSKGDVRRDLEDKISQQVKGTDNNIDNVYVSSNPDFVDRMTDYGDKIQRGEPVEGLFEEFGEMVQRVFPNAR
ncbi:hypothetical protein GCM10008967_11860 [Bacillus carboniphilus]|uniref:YhcN/YlaJ family sporulation lipoprotein n=1 Tax=Bacillus carboniphilus TaxID=86663 RepID=A0ABP3FR36_9BACI